MEKTAHDTPLDAELAKTLHAIGARLHEHITAIIACLPSQGRSATMLTARFKIEGVVARRIVRAIAGPPGLVTLTRLPSPDNVRNFTNLVEFDGIHKEGCQSVRDALDDLAIAASPVGGGRARLTKRIRATLKEQGEDE